MSEAGRGRGGGPMPKDIYLSVTDDPDGLSVHLAFTRYEDAEAHSEGNEVLRVPLCDELPAARTRWAVNSTVVRWRQGDTTPWDYPAFDVGQPNTSVEHLPLEYLRVDGWDRAQVEETYRHLAAKYGIGEG